MGHLAVQLAKIQGVTRVVAAVGAAVGGDLLPRAIATLRPGGRLIFFNSGGGTVPAFDLLVGGKTITGLTMARFASTRRELYERHHERLWQLHRAGELRAAIHAEISLSDAASALDIIEARANRGKVVLRP